MSIKRVEVHAAVTVYSKPALSAELILLGVKRDTGENEICQFALEIPGTRIPIKEANFKELFDALRENCLQKAREAGITRP